MDEISPLLPCLTTDNIPPIIALETLSTRKKLFISYSKVNSNTLDFIRIEIKNPVELELKSMEL
jgi:hypothetical protein